MDAERPDRDEPWEKAWHEALYGPAGFYLEHAPAEHFTTTSHGGNASILAPAVIALARAHGASTIVDLGCGRGELLRAIAELDPALSLHGIDVVAAPTSLPAQITWHRSPGGGELPAELAAIPRDSLLIANEWLDVVPCPIVRWRSGAWVQVHTDDAGAERLAGPAAADDQRWLAQWWPSPVTTNEQAAHAVSETDAPDSLAIPVQAEVGRTRDEAWQRALELIRPRLALAIDYGHTREARPEHGTLVGYRDGHRVPATPDGSCDLTAHVAMDSLAAPGYTSRLQSQAEMIRELLPEPPAPPVTLASTDPPGYLRALAERGAYAEAVGPTLGAFTWAIFTRCESEAAATGGASHIDQCGN